MVKRTFPVSDFYIEDPAPASTPWEALQRAGPGEPEVSTMEQSHPLDAVIAEAMAALSESERMLALMAFVEQLSVRQIADLSGISKSEIHRRLPALRAKMAKILRDNPEVVAYMGESPNAHA